MMPQPEAINNTVPYELTSTGRPCGPLKKATYGISVFALAVWASWKTRFVHPRRGSTISSKVEPRGSCRAETTTKG